MLTRITFAMLIAIATAVHNTSVDFSTYRSTAEKVVNKAMHFLSVIEILSNTHRRRMQAFFALSEFHCKHFHRDAFFFFSKSFQIVHLVGKW